MGLLFLSTHNQMKAIIWKVRSVESQFLNVQICACNWWILIYNKQEQSRKEKNQMSSPQLNFVAVVLFLRCQRPITSRIRLPVTRSGTSVGDVRDSSAPCQGSWGNKAEPGCGAHWRLGLSGQSQQVTGQSSAGLMMGVAMVQLLFYVEVWKKKVCVLSSL